MPALVLGDLAVQPTTFDRAPDERGRSLQRTITGQLRGRKLYAKRAWTATIYAADNSVADGIHSRADPDTNITVTGELIDNASIACRVEVTGDSYVRDRDSWYRMIALSIREV